MLVVHVCRVAPPRLGGLEASVGGLARAQSQRGHQVRIVTLRDPGQEGSLPGIEVVRLVRAGPRRYPLALGLRAALRGADLVHVHAIDGLLDQVVAGRPSFPVGVSTHGAYFHTPRHRLLKALLVRTWTARSLRRARAVWFTSEVDRQMLAPAGVDGPVLPNGIELDNFVGVQRRPEPGLLLVLGRVDVHKGLDDLLEALPRARALRPELRVVSVGPEQAPGLVASLQGLAASRGVPVEFLGARPVAELQELLGRAERVVLPSRHEGQGLAALEAMAAGVPVLASDIGAFRAWGPHLQRASFRQPEQVAQALLLPPEPQQVAGAALFARGFGWDMRAAAFDAAYAAIRS
jgi:alpha-1,3-mannosyltransferase